MQALVVHSMYDFNEHYEELITELRSHNFKIITIPSLKFYPEILPQLNLEEPFIFYKNSSVRIEDPAGLWNYQKDHPDFHHLRIGDEYITHWPKKVVLFRSMITSREYNHYSFYVNTRQYGIKKPPIDPPHVFLYTHNRANYLQLTLNSYFHSLDNYEDIPFTIIMNEPTEDVRNVVLKTKEKYPKIEVFKCETNAYFSAINLAVQHYEPENFIIMEDDVILPLEAKKYFYNWPYKFAERLKYFDLSGWSITTDNCPEMHNMARIEERENHDWYVSRMEDITTKGHILLGQCLCVNLDFWLSCKFDENFWIPLDSNLHKKAMNRGYTSPALRAYHIGWNQEMDGFEKVNSSSRFKNPSPENALITLDGKKHNYVLKDILKLREKRGVKYVEDLKKSKKSVEI